MKSFKNLLEDKDYILSEDRKFSERGNTISYTKRNELEEYYNAYTHEKAYIEDGEYEFLGATQDFIEKKKAQLQSLEDSDVIFALRRMTNTISIDEHSLYDFIYFFERAKDDANCYFRMQEFINTVNAYFDITGEKPVNRLAWGWNQYHKKESPMGFLYGCVRNYLKRNDKFDKDQFNRIWFGRLP